MNRHVLVIINKKILDAGIYFYLYEIQNCSIIQPMYEDICSCNNKSQIISTTNIFNDTPLI